MASTYSDSLPGCQASLRKGPTPCTQVGLVRTYSRQISSFQTRAHAMCMDKNPSIPKASNAHGATRSKLKLRAPSLRDGTHDLSKKKMENLMANLAEVAESMQRPRFGKRTYVDPFEELMFLK